MLRNNMTAAEQRLWQYLRRQQLAKHKFRRQFPIGPYIVDFICLRARLILELDGGQHLEQTAYDRTRDQWLQSQGFRVMRFWTDAVFKQPEAVLERIAAVLEEPLPPPPRPLPPGEGETE